MCSVGRTGKRLPFGPSPRKQRVRAHRVSWERTRTGLQREEGSRGDQGWGLSTGGGGRGVSGTDQPRPGLQQGSRVKCSPWRSPLYSGGFYTPLSPPQPFIPGTGQCSSCESAPHSQKLGRWGHQPNAGGLERVGVPLSLGRVHLSWPHVCLEKVCEQPRWQTLFQHPPDSREALGKQLPWTWPPAPHP